MNNFLKQKKITLTFLILVFAGLGFLAYSKLLGHQDNLKPKRGDVVESIYGLGTVTADQIFHVRAGMALTVKKIFSKEGDFVKLGSSLVQLDDNIMRSPIDGTVTAVSYKDGELVTPQAAVVTVMNLEHLFLEVSLEQQSILRVKKDQKVFISFETLRDEKLEGHVASVYPRENQFIVRIELKNWPKSVLPGMTADVAILVGQKTNVLLIPLRALSAGQVIRVRNGKKEHLVVKLGVIDGEWGEIISDQVSENDELVSRK
jgi:multidrug efflux pump subunit AcrA (membrane-fusion protein)